MEIYHRNISISNLSSIKFPILLRLLESTLPEGVELKVQKWDPEIEELRYVPDKQLIDLKTELESMQKKWANLNFNFEKNYNSIIQCQLKTLWALKTLVY